MGIPTAIPSSLPEMKRSWQKRRRRHAKKKKGSKNRAKARLKVARIHKKIADRRRDYQHKLSTQIIRENQVVCVESLARQEYGQEPQLGESDQ